jgi:hypothetical protein
VTFVGLPALVTDIKGNKTTPTYSTTYTYDNVDRLIKESIPFENVNGTIDFQIKKHDYDRNGNVQREKISKNKVNEASYPFVSDQFKKRVLATCLEGFKFVEVWNSEQNA